jgi:hypothetical protein
MRRSLLVVGLVAALPILAACAGPGETPSLSLAELASRCEGRGGTLQPTGRRTGEADRDHVCQEALVQVRNHRAQATRNMGVDRVLRNGE